MHMKSLTFAIAIAGTLLAIVSTPLGIAADNTLRIPAFTAYLEPDDGGARISSKSGVTSWKDASTKVLWFGELKKPGELNAAVELRLPQDANSKLRLTVAGQSRDAVVKGAGTNTVTARFGTFTVAKPGYQKFTLESLNASGQSSGDIDALVLDGVTTNNTHFNYKSRRNAASVHLGYPVPKGTNVAAFYCEMTGLEDPVHTYYMACGWHRGYFGMQVNSTTERRIIFSVWDSGGEGVDRKKVEDDNRVKLMGKGENVYTGDFGNEGTGGHSHLKFQWKTGEKQRFVVTAQPTNQTFTIYSGYWFHPEKKEWMLISSWRAPKEGGWLRGLEITTSIVHESYTPARASRLIQPELMNYFLDRVTTLNPNFKKTKLGTALEKNLREIKRLTSKPVDTPIAPDEVQRIRELVREINTLIGGTEE